MRIGNLQLKQIFKQLYIFMVMLIVVECYFAYFLLDSKYTALAQQHYAVKLVILILFAIITRGRPSFTFKDSDGALSFRMSWFFLLKKERTFEIKKEALIAFKLKGTFIYRWLQIGYSDNGEVKNKTFQINYLGSKSRMKLKKSLTRILDENQITQ